MTKPLNFTSWLHLNAPEVLDNMVELELAVQKASRLKQCVPGQIEESKILYNRYLKEFKPYDEA